MRVCGPWSIIHCLFTFKKLHLTGSPLLLVSNSKHLYYHKVGRLWYFSFPLLHVAEAAFSAGMGKRAKANFYYLDPTHRAKVLFQTPQDQNAGLHLPHPVLLGWKFWGKNMPRRHSPSPAQPPGHRAGAIPEETGPCSWSQVLCSYAKIILRGKDTP